MKKTSAIILTLLFIVFGRYQTNDTDPMIWVVIYGVGAVLSILVFFDEVNRPVLKTALIAYLVGAVMLWPSQFDGLTLENGYTPAIEEARESLGLLIGAIAMAWLLFVAKAGQTTDS